MSYTFQPVNPNGAYGACYSPSPLQAQVDQMQRQMDQALKQVQQQIRGQIQQEWERIRPELSRVWQAPELYNREIGIPAGERLHQQLGSILKETVQPMRQGMREIYQQSPETAKRLVWELAGRAVGTIHSEHTSQVCQQAKILIPPSTDEERCEQAQQIWEMEQGMQQRRLEEQKNMAQRIWEILGLPQRS